jgi:hypothetical protein
LQDLSVLILQLAERPFHKIRSFVLKQTGFGAGLPAGNLAGILREIPHAAIAAEHLLHYVIGDGVHVSPQAFGVFDHAPPEVSNDAQQSLLLNVFGDVPGPQARYRLDTDQIAEIFGEMLGGRFIVFPEAPNVVRVE